MNTITIPEQKFFHDKAFPLALSPTKELVTADDTVKYIKDNYDSLMDQLLEHGAILFRGFPITDAKEFNAFSLAFGWEDLPYIGGAAVRTNVYGVVFTS